RTRAFAKKVADTRPKLGEILETVAKALETGSGVEILEPKDVADYDGELARAEGASDTKAFERHVVNALVAIHATELFVEAGADAPHEVGLGHFNPGTRELCLFDHPGWTDTVRHEAFHQFIHEHAPK